MSKIRELGSRLPLKAIIPILLISTLCVVSFATSATISSQTYQGLGGVIIHVTDNYTIEPLGFFPSSGVDINTQWASGKLLSPGVPSGNWMYEIKVTANIGATTNPTVDVQLSSDGGASYNSIGTVTVTGTILSGSFATFAFDADGIDFSLPVSIVITVM
jgi:hypothetical protein